MNSEINQKVARILGSTEKIIWCDQPKIKLFSLLDLFIVPFTCIWTSMPLLASINAWSKFIVHKKGEDVFMLLWLSMFAAFGLYITIGRFIHEYFRRRGTYFIVTNQRVISLSKFWPQMVHSRELDQLENMVVMRTGKNSSGGTIFFEQSPIIAQLKVTAAVPLAYGTQKKLIFYDLEHTEPALAAIKNQCRDGQLQIEEIDPVSFFALARRFSKFDLKAMQNTAKAAPVDELIEREKFTPNTISHLPKNEARELIRIHRRLYIGRSVGMLAGVLCAFAFGLNALSIYAERSQAVLDSKNWPMTPGKIDKLEIISSKGPPYLRTLKITFKADGKNYLCEKYSYEDRSDKLKDAEYRFALSHKLGDVVDVFFDPKDPEKNVITRSTVISHTQENMGRTFIAIGLFLLSVVVSRLVLLKFKSFEPKPLKSESLGAEIFRAAFLSVWACMFFGGIVSMSIGPLLHAPAHSSINKND